MIIVWGTKLIRKKLGWAADWCDLCREPRAFKVTEVREVSHIYYLSLGKGNLHHYEKECAHCKTVTNADPEDYLDFVTDFGGDMEDLFRATHPDLVERNREKIDRTERIKTGALSPEERVQLIAESMVTILPQLERRASATSFDLQSGLGCLGTLVLGFGVIAAAASSQPTALVYFAGALAAAAAVWTLYKLFTDASRYAEKTLFPMLVPALKELKPTESELEEVLAIFKRQGIASASKISARNLHEALQGHAGAGS